MDKPNRISIVLKEEEFSSVIRRAFYDPDVAEQYAHAIEGWVETVGIEDAYDAVTADTRMTIMAACSKRLATDKSNAFASIDQENDLDDGLENLPQAEYSENHGVHFVSIKRRFDENEDETLAKKGMRKAVRDYLSQAMKLRAEGWEPSRIQTLLRKHFSET